MEKYIGFIVLPFVFYCIAILQNKKRFHKWLMPWEWISGIWLSMFGDYKVQHVLEHSKNVDDSYWYPSEKLIKEIAPLIYEDMEKNGYSKRQYIPNRNDCDDYTIAGMFSAHNILLDRTKQLKDAENKGLPILPFSFRRDDNGKRHRLFFIIDNNGKRWYIDSWIIKDKNHTKDGMFRVLSKNEEKGGFIPW